MFRKSISPGQIITYIIIALAMLLWIPGYSFSELSNSQIILTSVAKIAAFGGMAMFAWSLILSGRFKLFDSLFKGLDKVYKTHRRLGSIGLILLLLHPLALVLNNIPARGSQSWEMLWNFKYFPIALGLVALYGSILLIVWSLFAKARHEVFVRVHRYMGLLFIAGWVHAFLAGSVLASNPVMYWYMLGLCLAASLVFAHYSILADVLHRYFKYEVSKTEQLKGGVLRVLLKPKYRVLNFNPGQFVYASFPGLSDQSYHPFTIASGRKSSTLELYIKELGDFTKELSVITNGDPVRIKGPYGGFTFDDKRFHKQIWIAGGIGITPFLSKARSLEYSRSLPEIELIYATQRKYEGFAEKELSRIKSEHRGFNFTLLHETKFGQKTLKEIAEHFRSDLKDCSIYLCGPPAMLNAYRLQAEEMGISNQLYFEEFTY